MRKVIILLIFLSLVTYIAYEGLIYIDQNFKYGRMRETPGVRPHEEALLTTEEGIVPVGGGEEILMVTANETFPASPFPKGDPKRLSIREKGFILPTAFNVTEETMMATAR